MNTFESRRRLLSMSSILNHVPNAGVKEAYALTLKPSERAPRGEQDIKTRADMWGNVRRGWRS